MKAGSLVIDAAAASAAAASCGIQKDDTTAVAATRQTCLHYICYAALQVTRYTAAKLPQQLSFHIPRTQQELDQFEAIIKRPISQC